MLMVQFRFNLIVHKTANRHINSILKELRKLMDLPRTKGENVCVINILQNSTSFLNSWHEKVDKILRRKTDSKAAKTFCTLSVTVVRVNNSLKLYTILLHLDIILAKNLWGLCPQTLNGGVVALPHTP